MKHKHKFKYLPTIMHGTNYVSGTMRVCDCGEMDTLMTDVSPFSRDIVIYRKGKFKPNTGREKTMWSRELIYD